MWAWSVSLNLDNWPALRARFNSERTQVISGSNHGFKDRSTVRQSNPSKFYRCGTMQVQIWISTYVILKTIYFIRFFFLLHFPVTSHTSGVEESSEESREPRQEPAENTSVHVPRRSMSANVLRAVMTIPPPRFSRATVECAAARQVRGEWLRAEIGAVEL